MKKLNHLEAVSHISELVELWKNNELYHCLNFKDIEALELILEMLESVRKHCEKNKKD